MRANNKRPMRAYFKLGAVFAAGLFLAAVYFSSVGQRKPKPDPLNEALAAYDRADYGRTIKLLKNQRLKNQSRKILISAYLNSGRYGEAAQSLEDLADESRDSKDAATALYLLSVIARGQKDYERATSLLQQAITIDHRPQLRRDLADIYLEAGRNEQAVIELEQLLAGAHEGIDVAGTRSKLIAAYQALGRPERARQVQQEAPDAGTTP